ncbi:hypothetical protein GCM10011371_23950 [Novosphingobium marinum]|uniref:Lipoprotein n=1 Tax=Novosphingobium marinum TaxID=1514948 RepID=A0A7Y9Y026_9SPHN|nr:hypothetical protein [Novosphingobium marinum]NYH96510.1 hypothetical protein [Novosphingobium marinum]GGC35789.1 hypothetical protein GCM10011371_23950 [Novosphingobium marinum]
MRRLLIIAASSLALASCGQSDTPVVESEKSAEQGERSPLEPGDTSLADPAGGSVTAPAPGAGDPEGAGGPIPGAIQGRWGLVAADCTSTRGDAKGLLEVGAEQLRFYESVATIETVTESSASNLRGTFAFTGEGQSWVHDVSLTLDDGGQTLVRKDTGADAMPGELKYQRCG